MYEELVKKLRRCGKGLCTEDCPDWTKENLYHTCQDELVLEAADAIEKLIEIIQNHDFLESLIKPCWIPVTERLPEAKRKSYWVCTDTGCQCECRWTNNRFGIGESDEWGWSIFDITQYQKVVAWMSLPKPYEPPKEE